MDKMTVIEMTPFPPHANPYREDAYHMGVSIGKNVKVMMSNHDDEICRYLIIVNIETGERLRITIPSGQ